MSDLIDRQAAVKALEETKQSDPFNRYEYQNIGIDWSIDAIKALPPAQPQYEELTPEEAASEIASGSTMSAWYWLDDMIRLNQMGYAICRKR